MSEADSAEIEGFLAAHEPFEEAAAFKRNDRIGDWTVLAFLGRGATSEVYRAENSVTRQVGAVKVLMRGDDKAQERFRREIALLTDTGCAALPRFYGAGKHCGRSFLATELLEPADLPSYDAAIARFLLGVCDGVAEIDRSETFARLKVKTLYNQLVFASSKALSFLRYRKAEVFYG